MSEKKGLFYDVSGTTDRYRNIGSFVFTFEVRPDKIYEAAECVIEILKSIKSTLLPEDECMKAGYVDNVKLLCDDVRELGFTMAYDNRVMGLGYSSPEARAKAYAAVTPGEIQKAANEIFKPENLTLTLKGNKRKIDTFRLENIISDF
jgi:predicted Zn-dependent peptidase